jgi:hypothetical protein
MGNLGALAGWIGAAGAGISAAAFQRSIHRRG